MSLSMRGHIDNVFKSVPATHVGKSGSYVDGIWTSVTSAPVAFMVNIQPLSDKEIDFLRQGGQRIVDPRKYTSTMVTSTQSHSMVNGYSWVSAGKSFAPTIARGVNTVR